MKRRILEVDENSPLGGLGDADMQFLRTSFARYMTQRRGGWAFVRMVGHIVLPSGCILRVRSTKAPNHALVSWLAYTDPGIQELLFESDAQDLAGEGELSGLLAAVYVRQLVRACTISGVTRLYQPVPTTSPFVRGRIDMTRLARRGEDLSEIPCTTWLRVTDTPLNCFLAAALARARQDPLVSARLTGMLARASTLLAGIPARIDEGLLRGSRTLARNEQPFHGAYRLARMILQSTSLEDGRHLPGFAFMLNLEHLFESAVVTAFRRGGLDFTPKWKATYAARERQGDRGPMVLDLLCRTSRGRLVVDAKFKRDVSTSNLQQMVTYCFLSGARRAWLVLPGDPQEPAEYRFVAPDGYTIVVETRYLATNAVNRRGWEQNGAALVRELLPPGSALEPSATTSL